MFSIELAGIIKFFRPKINLKKVNIILYNKKKELPKLKRRNEYKIEFEFNMIELELQINKIKIV